MKCGDVDGDGFVEYVGAPARARRPRVEGLRRSQCFADGTIRPRPDPPWRCRATSTTRCGGWPSSRARSGATRELARAAGGVRRTRSSAGSTPRSGSSACGGYYALALDGDKPPGRFALLQRRPPALERDRAARAGRGDRRARSSAPGLWSGWGVRRHHVRRRRGLQPARPTTTAPSGRTTTSLDRLGSRAVRALAGGASDRAGACSVRRATSATSFRRCSRASSAARLRFRSRIRRRPGRRPGQPERLCCCSARARPRAGCGRGRAPDDRPRRRRGRRGSSSTAYARSGGPGTCVSRRRGSRS